MATGAQFANAEFAAALRRQARLTAEAKLAREHSARLEARSEAADAAGDHELADKLHRRARLHRADARALEAELG